MESSHAQRFKNKVRRCNSLKLSASPQFVSTQPCSLYWANARLKIETMRTAVKDTLGDWSSHFVDEVVLSVPDRYTPYSVSRSE